MISSVVFFQCCQTSVPFPSVFLYLSPYKADGTTRSHQTLPPASFVSSLCVLPPSLSDSLPKAGKYPYICSRFPRTIAVQHTSFPLLWHPLQGGTNTLPKAHSLPAQNQSCNKKASIVSDILQIYLYSIRQLFSLHCVHGVQPLTSHQQHLKASIYIKITVINLFYMHPDYPESQ